MKLTKARAKHLLPKTVRLVYGFKDILASALEIGEEHEIGCDNSDKPEFVAVYKLIRVERRGRRK
jgi:hypothetical protein